MFNRLKRYTTSTLIALIALIALIGFGSSNVGAAETTQLVMIAVQPIPIFVPVVKPTVSIDLPGLPAIAVKAVVATNNTNKIEVSWTALSGTGYYQLQPNVNGVWKSAISLSANNYVYSAMESASYYFRVKHCQSVVDDVSQVSTSTNASEPEATSALSAPIGNCSTWSASSNTVVMGGASLPATPAVPQVVVSGTQATISWGAIAGATKYQVVVNQGIGPSIPVDVVATSYSVNLVAGQMYYASVRACNASGCGGYSSRKTFSLAPVAPVAPSVTVSAYNTSVTLGWPLVAGATSYKVYAYQSGKTTRSYATNQRSYEVSVEPGATLQFAVQACNLGGCSALSAKTNITIPTADADFIQTAPLPATVTVPSEEYSSTGLVAQQLQVRVTEQGAAISTIPVLLPPATAGFSPEVAISYSSQAGRGQVGLGWNIAAVAAITRCNKSLEEDGEFQQIFFDSRDALCLSGSKLRLVTGTNLTSGAKYRLDSDPNTLVTQINTGMSSYFELRRGNGEVERFGGTTNSVLIDGLNNQIYHWALSRKSNSYGRVIDYDYSGKEQHFLRLRTIKYDGNVVDFGYKDRNDYVKNYYYGNRVSDSLILDDITIKNYQMQNVRYYRFGYEASRYSGLSLLKTVQLCDSPQQLVCAKELTFDYSDYDYSGLQSKDVVIALSKYGLPSIPNNNCYSNVRQGFYEGICGIQRIQISDIDGDGSKELIITSSKGTDGEIFTFTQSSTGLVENPNYRFTVPLKKLSIIDRPIDYFFPWQLVDKNGDGVQEFDFSGGYRNSGVVYYDWDGDGIDELSELEGDHVAIYAESVFSTGGWGDSTQVYPFGLDSNIREILIDINHDGLMDRAVPVPIYDATYWPDSGNVTFDKRADNWALELSTVVGGKYHGISPKNEYLLSNEFEDMYFWGDVNGDGYPDKSTRTNSGVNYQLNGEELKNYPGIGCLYLSSCLRSVIDINGDGLGDWVYWDKSNFMYAKSLSDGFEDPVVIASPTWLIPKDHESSYLWQDLDGDDQPELIFYHHANNAIYIRYDNNVDNVVLDKLININNGLGKEYQIDYRRMNDPEVYDVGRDNIVRKWGKGSVVRNVGSSMPVVKAIREATTSNGSQSIFDETQYHYYALRTQAGGKGSLGFAKVVSEQQSNQQQITKTFRQDGAYAGQLEKTEVRVAGQLLLEQQVTDWYQWSVNDKQSTVVKPKTTVTKQYFANGRDGEIDSSELALTQTQTNIIELASGGYLRTAGQVTTSLDQFDNSETSQTINYRYEQEDLSNWYIARPTSTTTTSTRSGQADITQSHSTLYNSKAKVAQQVQEPNSTNNELYLLTDFQYDSVGNLIQQTQCSIHFKDVCAAANVPDVSTDVFKVFRRSYFDFDTDGRWLIAKRNPVFTEQRFADYNPFGQPQRVDTTPYDGRVGQVDYVVYNRLGEAYFRYNNQGDSTLISKSLCSQVTDCPDHAVWVTNTISASQGDAKQYFDLAGRVVRDALPTLSGEWRLVDREFDLRGRESAVSSPYIGPAAVHWQRLTYDNLDRKVSVVTADDLTTRFAYQQGKLYQDVQGQYSDPKQSAQISQQRIERKNGRGEVVASQDNTGKDVSFAYNALGLVNSVINVDSSVTGLSYDVLGRRQRFTDPNKGLQISNFNALGEVVKVTANDNTVTETYRNNLGQVVKRSTVKGSESFNASFDYANSPLLHAEQTGNQKTTYHYDEYHRLAGKNYQIDGKTWSDSHAYDAVGRLFRTLDIAGSGRGLQFQYDAGMVTGIFEVKTGSAYYRALHSDAFGKVDSALFANRIHVQKDVDAIYGRLQSLVAGAGNIENLSFTYDSIGNLRYRAQGDALGKVLHAEYFEYDKLNRLTSATLDGLTTLAVSYYDNGNIQTKSDQQGNAVYYYGQQHSQCLTTPGVHALTQVGANRYCYDARGNQTQFLQNAVVQRSVQYSVFDKPLQITSLQGNSQLSYDANTNLAKRVDTLTGKTTKTTYYVAGHEVIYFGDGRQELKRYLGDFAIHTIANSGVE